MNATRRWLKPEWNPSWLINQKTKCPLPFDDTLLLTSHYSLVLPVLTTCFFFFFVHVFFAYLSLLCSTFVTSKAILIDTSVKDSLERYVYLFFKARRIDRLISKTGDMGLKKTNRMERGE